MNKELSISAKKYNFLERLKVNDYVDAIDENRWKIAKIVDFKTVGHRHTIRLHFDGFPASWDQDFDLPAATKMAPFRKFTSPYTGPQAIQKTIFRAQANLNFEGPLSSFKRLNKSDKQKLDAQWIIQHFRGDIFILMDSLLTQNARLKSQQYEQVLKFFQAYIQIGVSIIKYSLEKINEINKQNINESNLIYVSSMHALASSLPQILFNFNSMVSPKQKRVKFYNQIQSLAENSRKRIRNFMIGKDIILLCKSIMQYQNPPHRGFPWNIKKQVLILLSGLQQHVQFPKLIESKQISQALDMLPYLKFKQAFSETTIQSIHIELILTLIVSGNFQGKLKGLSELKKLLQGVYPMKKQFIKQRILTNNLLLTLTDNSIFNSEIFKRSMPIFSAAAKYDLLTDEILKRIIGLHKDKHQLQLKSYYSTLAEFGSILSQKKTIQFFENFREFPIDTYLIIFLKQFTMNVITHHPTIRKKYMQPHTGFGLTYLWKLIEQVKEPQILNAAIQSFACLAGDLYYRKVVQQYLAKCFSYIKNGKNVQNSLKIIHLCLSRNKEQNKQFASYIDSIDRQFGLIDTIISSLTQSSQLSNNTISSMFQFLEEVNQFLYRKMTVEHMKILWKLKQCQAGLFKFMRKYNVSRQEKSTDKIVNKKLQPLQIKQIISKIFLNKTLMNNYLNIDQQACKAIDELIVSYNYRSKSIDYNFKHTIRCITVNSLFGLEVYLQIAMNCKDQNIANKCLKRFVQYYLRPMSIRINNKNQKINVWLACADKITKYMQESPKKYVGYSTLFQQIKGRMQSINILDPTPCSFTVLNKTQGSKKVLTMPKNYSLWKLRHIINESFKLNFTNFEIYIPAKQTVTDMQKEEDFSIVFIQASRDPSSITVVITQSKQPHPHFVAIEDFKMNFSNVFAEKIYENLSSINELDIQLIALNILRQIPYIKNLQTRLSKLDINKQNGWEDILDSQCRPRLFYQLTLLNKIKGEGIPWVMSFISKNGVQHLQKILRSRCLSKSPLTSKDYQFYIQLIQFFNQIIQFYKIHKPNLPFNESSVIQIMRVSNADSSNISLQSSTAYLNYFYLTWNTFGLIVQNYHNIDPEKILTNKSIIQLIEILSFTDQKTKLQQRFPKTIIQIFQKAKCQNHLNNYAQGFLSLCLSSPKARYNCRVFFDILVLMFDTNVANDKLYQKVLQFIKIIRFSQIQVFYQKENLTNQLIFGWLRICKCLLLKSITTRGVLRSIPQSQQQFAQFLISEGLFKQSHRFQSQSCRNQAFQILSLLNCREEAMKKISKEVIPMLTKGQWRKQYQWYVKSFTKRQKNTKVGIRNLAATCYINSLLQQLFHITEFSQQLLSVDTLNINSEENIAYQLQKIFAYLKNSNRQIYSTQSFCQTFILDGQPIDPRIQMDIDEFFHALMDKLEQNLKQIKKQAIIDDVFQGQYSNLIIGQECQHKSQRVQNFLSMRLEIINKSSLTQALAQFIKGQVLQGQNAYFCQKCDKKIKAIKRVCVKSLPQVLILTLKRFQFDFDKMEKFKLNSFCQFPQTLNMEPYMRQSLYQNQQKLPSQQYMYTLKGVVIHYGISQAGHYTSYVKIQNGDWRYFDDDKISNFDFKQLGKQCFGGVDDNPYSDSSEKIKNAYLLIYERVNKKKHQKVEINQQIKKQVDAENLNNRQIQILFDPGLKNFFDSNHIDLGRTYILFIHLVFLRSDFRHQTLQKCYENCINIFTNKQDIASWYLQNFSEGMIKEFLIYGHFQASYFVASLLIHCISLVNNQDFIKRCMKCLEKSNMVPLNKIYQAASYIPPYFKTLAQYSFHEKIYRIIKQEKVSNPGSLSKINSIRTQFGEPCLQFSEKKDYKGTIQLMHSIEPFKFKNIGIQDLDSLIKKAKKLSTQTAVAKFFAPKLKQEQSFRILLNQLIIPILVKSQLKFQEQYIFKFALVMMAKICEIKDELTRKRAAKIAEVYMLAIKESLDGYKPMRMILEGLFSLCFNNQIFHQQFISVLNNKDHKKFIKLIRDWMKESQKVVYNVRVQKIGYWRKPNRVQYGTTQRIQNHKVVKSQTYLSLFNSMLQKHKIQFSDLLSPKIKVGEKVSLNEFEEYQYQVSSKFGLILALKSNDGSQRYILQDDAYPQRSI